ncbi:hypothetical protein GCM10023088_74070 [Actinomadura verrucosospora]
MNGYAWSAGVPPMIFGVGGGSPACAAGAATAPPTSTVPPASTAAQAILRQVPVVFLSRVRKDSSDRSS